MERQNTHNAGQSLSTRTQDVKMLYAMAKRKTPEARAQLVDAISNIFDVQLSDVEKDSLAGLLITLMKQAEKDVRRALSERLADRDDVPERLVMQLATDEIDVAESMLLKSRLLCEYDLMFIVKSKSAEYWRVIASRAALHDPLIDALADTGDFDTAMNLAENKGITLTPHAATTLSDLAQEHEALAVPLLHRDDVSSDLAAQLYRMVGEDIKAEIKSQKILTETAASVVDETVASFVLEDDLNNERQDDTLRAQAMQWKQQNRLTPAAMHDALRNGQLRWFIAQFEIFTDLPHDTVMAMLQQKNGQSLAIACRAHDIEKKDFVSFFLLTHRLCNDFAMADAQDLRTAIQYFDKATPDIARQIMKKM